MTYRPPAIREARDLTDALYDAALELKSAALAYGMRGTLVAGAKYDIAHNALDAACAKLRDHLEQMARSERGAA